MLSQVQGNIPLSVGGPGVLWDAPGSAGFCSVPGCAGEKCVRGQKLPVCVYLRLIQVRTLAALVCIFGIYSFIKSPVLDLGLLACFGYILSS